MKKIILLIILLVSSCSEIPFTTDTIMFDKKIYSPTNSQDISIFNSRLDIPQKFIEIGTIKYQGVPDLEQIKILAAKKGANAILKDANNYILIKYYLEKEKNDEESKII